MPKALSYADAVRILGQGPDFDWMRRLNDLTGGLLLSATLVTPATVLSWFDAHAQFARLSQQLVKVAAQRLTGAHRLSRTERISAAHTVIVIAAYFDALSAAELPFDLSAARLTVEDQLHLTRKDAGHGNLAEVALRVAVGLPEPHDGSGQYLSHLTEVYRGLSTAVGQFLRGLAPWDDLSPGQEAEVDRILAEVPARAGSRYAELLLDLRNDCPEAELWLREQRATALSGSVQEIHDLMHRIGGPSADATGVADLLRRSYAALLDRPIVETGDLPAGLGVPSLREAYLPSLFRVAEAASLYPASDERFWENRPVRADLYPFLAGYLTSPRAQSAPIVVLGQPGAGKSVLTKVLAAELAEGGFLPVRVPLRDVDTTLDLQRQVEQSIQITTTETAAWPRLAESADGGLPVILLDGFDELLQATATSQSDYLYKVADFQRREAALGRAVAFVVTTRSSVADRAVAPPDTLFLRLEPFDADRVTAWLTTWQNINGPNLAARGLRPLPAEVARRFPDLAGQPLLLLLLALYDADENALQHTDELSESDLYERLLVSFARREVRKAGPHLSEAQCHAALEEELRRLSVVAFAMLNRSAQWVTEADLVHDLAAVFGPEPRRGASDGMNTATLLLGRFFFVHRAQAVRGRQALQTYEFLHATFGEYLVARYTWQLLREVVARDSVTASPNWNNYDGLFARLLSFAPLVVRAPIVRFLAEMAGELDMEERRRWLEVVFELYRRCMHISWVGQAGDYRPVVLGMPARYAGYSANLVLLAVTLAPGLRFGVMAEPAGVLGALSQGSGGRVGADAGDRRGVRGDVPRRISGLGCRALGESVRCRPGAEIAGHAGCRRRGA
ncbi:NACHT domain-containing protein [Actinoplanes sp. GCM10030250]|uniref:NACHT domain-containing protein n=1 Tax=Actinoplanes sp. GCM10030250 TaxID=3273376 RepID=UPI00361B0F6C